RAMTILFSVPLALIGAVLGLYFSGNSFSFMAFLGVVSLAGMVIKNAVVWVEFVDRALEQGQDLKSAIVDAGLKRARPILLTAGTTIGGLLPLALFGGILWEGMAWAMAVGLAMATALTLVVIPIVFYLMFRRSTV
ncbi:MAG: efflux RND transporter permease subunit, partial [Deltaproteobacteria bacterium]|nr:efflux RND transporter permease subunit [Deltaproteobacteria bacterium]